MPFLSPAFRADRRAFLRRARPERLSPPPWTDADRLAAACSRCDACIAVCPESILIRSAGGFPNVDFTRGECTFCAACARACKDEVFVAQDLSPWRIKAEVADVCLAHRDIVCQSCKDACGTGAIRFPAVAGRVATPLFDPGLCTGCGACVSPCPVKAITVRDPSSTDAAA